MKIEWSIVNETSVGSPAKAKRDLLGMILDSHFLAGEPLFQASFVVEEPLCDVE